MKPKNVLARELIGRSIEVVNATNKSLIGIKGRIIDETKNTITIELNGGKRTLLKEQITFITTIEGKRIKIDGKKITKRPDKRY